MQFRDKLTYEEYLDRQLASKSRQADKAKATARSDHKAFKLKFRRVAAFIDHPVVCLGAGIGTEVRAMRSVGHESAVGLDIGNHPGSEGLVQFGNFMSLTDPDNHYGFAYTNCFNQTKDPIDFIRGLVRVMQPESFALIDVACDPEADPEWTTFPYWRPSDLEEISALLDRFGATVVADWAMRKPAPGRSYLLKFKSEVAHEDTGRIELALSDIPDGDKNIRRPKSPAGSARWFGLRR